MQDQRLVFLTLDCKAMTAQGTFADIGRQDSLARRAGSLRCFLCGFVACKIGILLEIAVNKGRCAEIKDDAVGFDDARIFFRIDNPQTPPDHLDHGGFIGRRAQENDAGCRRMVPAFGQDADIDEHFDFVAGGLTPSSDPVVMLV